MKKLSIVCVMTIFISITPAYGDSSKSKDSLQMREIKANRFAREKLTPHLKDSSSAEFRNQVGLCGEVNSKNSFGGYTGYQRFIVGGDNGSLVILERESGLSKSDFDTLWNNPQICGSFAK